LLKTQEAVLKGHTSCVNSVDISENNKFIVSGSKDKTVRVWDFFGKNIKSVLHGHGSSVLSVAVTRNNVFIISASEDYYIRVWKLQE
jgi:FOG: WD40 repeat